MSTRHTRSKITAELAAVRMTPERRAEIERLVTQAIDEAVATAVNVEAVANRENDNYLRGYCDGATETAQRVNSAAYSAAKSLADLAFNVSREAENARCAGYQAHGVPEQCDVTAAKQRLAAAAEKSEG